MKKVMRFLKSTNSEAARELEHAVNREDIDVISWQITYAPKDKVWILILVYKDTESKKECRNE